MAEIFTLTCRLITDYACFPVYSQQQLLLQQQERLKPAAQKQTPPSSSNDRKSSPAPAQADLPSYSDAASTSRAGAERVDKAAPQPQNSQRSDDDDGDDGDDGQTSKCDSGINDSEDDVVEEGNTNASLEATATTRLVVEPELLTVVVGFFGPFQVYFELF